MGKLLLRMKHSEHPGWAALLSLVLSPAPNCPGGLKPLLLLTGKGKGTQTHPKLTKTRSRFGPIKEIMWQGCCRTTEGGKGQTGAASRQINTRMGLWESLTPLCSTQDPVIEFLHKPFLLGVCGTRRRPEQISENSILGTHNSLRRTDLTSQTQHDPTQQSSASVLFSSPNVHKIFI